MKRFLLLISILLLLTINSYSRLRIKDEKYKLSIGPYIALSGGSAKFYYVDGLKSSFAMNIIPDFGVSGFIPIIKSYSGYNEQLALGLYCNLGYSTISFKNIEINNNNSNWITRTSYLTLNTELSLLGCEFGCFLSLPINGKMEYSDSALSITSNLNFMFGIYMGFILPIYYDKIGRLNIYAHYLISLTKQFSSDGLPEYNSENYNTKQIAITLGINYLFNLSK